MLGATNTGAVLSFAMGEDFLTHRRIFNTGNHHRTAGCPDIAELCRRYGVRRLEIFGSAARGKDCAPERSDADFLVECGPETDVSPLKRFFGFEQDLERLLQGRVDLVERSALEISRNYIRRRSILRERESVYG